MSIPTIVESVKGHHICPTCGMSCWNQVICSSCQVRELISIEAHHIWKFSYVAMWAKRINEDVRQPVKVLYAYDTLYNRLQDVYTVHARVIDGAGEEITLRYWNDLTEKQAERLANTLESNPDVSLNGKYWV